jgi:hypothetical protein
MTDAVAAERHEKSASRSRPVKNGLEQLATIRADPSRYFATIALLSCLLRQPNGPGASSQTTSTFVVGGQQK